LVVSHRVIDMATFEHDADITLQDDAKKQKAEHESGHGHSHAHGSAKPGEGIVALGTVTLGGATFTIDREGQVEPGKETTFGVELISGTGVPSKAWLVNPDGEELGDRVGSEDHNQHWHFTVLPLIPVKKSKFVLRVGEEEALLDFAWGAAPCNDGILSVVKAAHAPQWRGFLELKLHGDAGDLELWLYAVPALFGTRGCAGVGEKPIPFDVPKETVLRLSFPSHPGKALEMSVRNMEENEDEDGKPNMRGGCTNYFIFPGETGQDPEWIKGETWRGLATVAFEVDGKAYACDPFVLVPHEAL